MSIASRMAAKTLNHENIRVLERLHKKCGIIRIFLNTFLCSHVSMLIAADIPAGLPARRPGGLQSADADRW